jgi:hypothetical protein
VHRWRDRIVLIAFVLFLAFALVWVFKPSTADRFDERQVATEDLPPLVREYVVALGGGRCVEQHPSVYFCITAEPNQNNEGPAQREWCYDSDGQRTIGTYPARRERGVGPWKCHAG